MKQNHDKLLTNYKSVNVTWIKVLNKYFFFKIREKIKKYVKKCEIYAKTKKLRQLESSMQSLEVSIRFWQSMTMNFITNLSKFINLMTQVSYDEILVMIDRFSKMIKFVFVKSKQTIEQLTYILIKKLIITKEVLESIVFNKDKLFVLKFWTILCYESILERLVNRVTSWNNLYFLARSDSFTRMTSSASKVSKARKL